MFKLALRSLAVCVVLAGASAVSLSSATTQVVTSHQSSTAAVPVPFCGPWVACPGGLSSNLR